MTVLTKGNERQAHDAIKVYINNRRCGRHREREIEDREAEKERQKEEERERGR